MADFPTTIPTHSDLTCGDPRLPKDEVNAVYGEVIALATKVGATGSAVTTTHDYKLSEVTTTDKAVGKTATQTLTNKTLTSPTINSPQINEAVTMTATATELNLIDGSVTGTSVASKALVLGASKNTDLLTIDKAIKFNSPSGFMVNGTISRTVSSNNLTVAIKTVAGTDPSATDPVYLVVDGTVRAITAALSSTANAGTNWCNSGASETATQEIDYFVYLGWKASTSEVFIGFARIPYGVTFADFNGTTGQYSLIANTAPASTDSLYVIGRFNATLSAGAGYTWSIPATSVIINRPIYETRMLTYTPTLVGWSAAPTGTVYRYRVVNTFFDLIFRQATGNTSNSTSTTTTMPFSTVLLTNYVDTNITTGEDNGAAFGGRGEWTSNSNIITFQSTLLGGGWTASGTKRIRSFRALVPLSATT